MERKRDFENIMIEVVRKGGGFNRHIEENEIREKSGTRKGSNGIKMPNHSETRLCNFVVSFFF